MCVELCVQSGVGFSLGLGVDFFSGNTLLLKLLGTFSLAWSKILTFSKKEMFSIGFLPLLYNLILWTDYFGFYQHYMLIKILYVYLLKI